LTDEQIGGRREARSPFDVPESRALLAKLFAQVIEPRGHALDVRAVRLGEDGNISGYEDRLRLRAGDADERRSKTIGQTERHLNSLLGITLDVDVYHDHSERHCFNAPEPT
jgi:hypothetical protein